MNVPNYPTRDRRTAGNSTHLRSRLKSVGGIGHQLKLVRGKNRPQLGFDEYHGRR